MQSFNLSKKSLIIISVVLVVGLIATVVVSILTREPTPEEQAEQVQQQNIQQNRSKLSEAIGEKNLQNLQPLLESEAGTTLENAVMREGSLKKNDSDMSFIIDNELQQFSYSIDFMKVEGMEDLYISIECAPTTDQAYGRTDCTTDRGAYENYSTDGESNE
jgi:Na+-transporting NADH:ubiquinone oxidoreductase subunit NqrC